MGAGKVDDVDGNDNGRCGKLQSGDNGVGVWVDANIFVVLMDKDHGGGVEARGVDRTTTIIALTIDRFDNDGGGKTKPAVIVDGETYHVVELRRGVVVPRRQLLLSLSSYHPSERAYWLRSELRGTIYGRVRRGTVLRRLDQPVHVSVDIEGSAVVEAGWMLTSVHVAIKEMSWELLGEHRSTLAKNPIKEVVAMQYLQAFVGDERQWRRRRRGEEG